MAERLIDVVKSDRCGKVIVRVTALVCGLYVDVATLPGHTCGVGIAVGELRLKLMLVTGPAALSVLNDVALVEMVSVQISSGKELPSVVPLVVSLSVAAYPRPFTMEELTLVICTGTFKIVS